MSLIIDFYKSLDTLNLIIFWGIIIVIILLLIFSIIISNKNKKLKNIIINSNNQKEKSNDIPLLVKEEKEVKIANNNINKSLNIKVKETNQEKDNTTNLNKPVENIEEEKSFVAEEHVIEYNKDAFSLSNIKKVNEYPKEKTNYEVKPQNEEIKMPTGPYQRNVLREMSLNQTSPIGIVKPQKREEKEITNAEELQAVLSENNQKDLDAIEIKSEPKKQEKIIEQTEKNIKEAPIQQEKVINPENTSKIERYQEHIQSSVNHQREISKPNIINEKKPTEISRIAESNISLNETPLYKESLSNNQKVEPQVTSEEKKISAQEKYLEEVSRVLANAEQLDSVSRTEYELQQEEDAIISYEELMQKKDSIKMIDEEEAVISIEELMNKKQSKEKLYKLTEDEENDMFIQELKDFRNDL